MIRQALILAAGCGRRLGGRGVNQPKGFIEIGGETLIERSVRILRSFGITQVVLGTGFLADRYEEYAEARGLATIRNSAFAETGSLETLCCAASKISEDFLLLESDLYYEERAVEDLAARGTADTILTSGFTASGDEVYVVPSASGALERLTKDADARKRAVGELVGISRIRYGTYRRILGWAEKSGRPSPLHYEDALTALAATSRIEVHKIEKLLWGEIDTAEHLARVKTRVFPAVRQKERAR